MTDTYNAPDRPVHVTPYSGPVSAPAPVAGPWAGHGAGPYAGGAQARRPLTFADARLTRLFQREPERCASVSEYASITGIDVTRVLDLLGPALQSGVLALETSGGDVFVHTAPYGRPAPAHLPEVSPNLWERLRVTHDRTRAHQLWNLYRDLEDSGWVVEANPAAIMFGLSNLGWTPPLGLRVSGRTYPLMAYPERDDLWRPDGQLAALAGAGSGAIAVVLDSGELDAVVTSVRKLFLSQATRQVSILLLEGPRFAPLLLSPDDPSVAPRSVSIAGLEQAAPGPTNHDTPWRPAT